jgi:hypothetical protein
MICIGGEDREDVQDMEEVKKVIRSWARWCTHLIQLLGR